MKHPIFLLGISLLLAACHNNATMISEQQIQSAITTVLQAHPTADSAMLARGAKQVAALWRENDGTETDYQTLIASSYAATDAEKEQLYNRMAFILEQCRQSADMLNNTLQEPTALLGKGDPTQIDWIISGYSPMAHFAEDMFANKIAHICVLNFPHYSLEEKNTLGKDWTRQEWAYARLGDVFSSRVPGHVVANYSQALSEAENYIAGYNIMMHCLRNEQGEQLWPEPMALLSHWNLRDELKSNYAEAKSEGLEARGREKQEMIYLVMLRIIRQEIPDCVVNSDQYLWAPYSNTATPINEEIHNSKFLTQNSNSRYQQIINIFHAAQQIDTYRSDAPTHILRTFNEDLQIPFEEIESLFTQLVQSDEVKQVAAIIRERLRRDLRPYDIWYDGFKSRSSISEDALTAETQKRYPDAYAFEKDMPRMLMDLGFASDKANAIASHIVVEAARGSGHARPCVGREQPARLRTRVGNKGMDYKGYNIAVHEFGHNVEEVISLYDIDHYTLAGIPNTGFTEASAFLFQERDLQLLHHSTQSQPHADQLFDLIWGMYEIMGVSLVDMRMWQWLYANPKATAADLREAVIRIASEVWNQYYAPVLGEKDSPLLAIYSHMIGYALYLPAYPIGNLVQYQLEEHLAQCGTAQEWAQEYTRIYQQGCLTPDAWMRGAVGSPMSVEPILNAVREALR
ncbi:MAG: hypothetical protein IKW35_09590 [Paludibacteraceae bacterium]|nr:hypothetical protein [Paludibacteraceae bacterium]